MTTESLQKALHAAPFQSFTLHLADGRTLPVPHRDFVAHRPGGRVAVIMDDDDGFELVDLLLVVSLKFEPARGRGPSGQKGRRS